MRTIPKPALPVAALCLALVPLQPSAAADAHTATTAANRPLIERFVKMLYTERDVKRAFKSFVATDYVQHNPGLPDGREGSIAALSKVFADPGANFAVQRILVDGDLAVIHYRGQLQTGDAGAAVVEIFRLESGRIVEHWDMLQAMPTKSKNAYPMF